MSVRESECVLVTRSQTGGTHHRINHVEAAFALVAVCLRARHGAEGGHARERDAAIVQLARNGAVVEQAER